MTDRDGKCLYSNAAYQKLCGWSADELIGSHWSAVVHSQDRDKAIRHWEKAVRGHCAFQYETRLELARRKAEEQLFEEKERAQVTLDSIGDAVLSTNIDGMVSYMNAVAEQLTGFSRDEAIGRPLNEIFHVVDAKSLKPTADPAQRAIQSDSIVALEANSLLIAKNGVKLAIEDSAAPIHNRDGAVTVVTSLWCY